MKKKVVKKVKVVELSPEEAVKLQTHCAKCGRRMASWVENNYKRYCGPSCAA